MENREHIALSEGWIKDHLFLQDFYDKPPHEDYRTQQAVRVLTEYVPPKVLADLRDRFIIVAPPLKDPATKLFPQQVKDLHVIVVQRSLIPNSHPPAIPYEFTAIILMHELAHISLNHPQPANTEQELEAYDQARAWFNMTQSRQMSEEELEDLVHKHHGRLP